MREPKNLMTIPDVRAMLRMCNELHALPPDPGARKRHLLARFLHMLGGPHGAAAPGGPGTPTVPGLSPRVQQTLRRLLAGDSEKQIAGRMGVSPHTVHVYVKALYRHFGVCSRGELFARFVTGDPADPRSSG